MSDKKTDKTLAPTNKGTADKLAESTAQFTELELDFVSLVEQHYGSTGSVMTRAVGEEDYGISKEEFDACVENPKVLAALEERGITLRRMVFTDDPTDDSTNSWRSKGLTPQQLVVANTMLDLLDTRSDKKKLQDLNVSTRTYQSWLMDPVFSGYLDDRAQRVVTSGQHEAAMALMDGVRQGNIKAIEYYHSYTGRFNKPTATGNQQGNGFDAQQLINDLVEIIVDEVDDPLISARIADRLKGLMTKRSIVNGLTSGSDPVGNANEEHNGFKQQVPKVAPNRVITPELQAAMSRGVGIDT